MGLWHPRTDPDADARVVKHQNPRFPKGTRGYKEALIAKAAKALARKALAAIKRRKGKKQT